MWNTLAINDHNRVLPPHVLKALGQAKLALHRADPEEAERLVNRAIALIKEARDQ